MKIDIFGTQENNQSVYYGQIRVIQRKTFCENFLFFCFKFDKLMFLKKNILMFSLSKYSIKAVAKFIKQKNLLPLVFLTWIFFLFAALGVHCWAAWRKELKKIPLYHLTLSRLHVALTSWLTMCFWYFKERKTETTTRKFDRWSRVQFFSVFIRHERAIS